MIARSYDLLPWIKTMGVRFQPSLGGTLSLGRTNSFFLGGGRAMLNSLYRRAESLGVRILYESPIVDIDIADGRFRSATVRGAGGVVSSISARAFVAAAGGFEANLDWLGEHWGDAARNFLIRGTNNNTGEILRMLLERGATPVGDPSQCHAVAIDARAPLFDGGIVTRLDCVVFGIVVNTRGERFYDEGEEVWPKRYAIWGRLVAAQPEQKAFIVFDAKSIELFMPSLYPAIMANSIGELAAKLELDPSTFERTVREFNAAVRPGTFNTNELDDCCTEGLNPPKSHWARTIDKAPFYAYPVRPGITFTYLGVRVDGDARMQLAAGGAENIYAAGEIMAGNVLGEGYAAGIGMTIGGVFGRLAGERAARHARN